MHFLSGRFFPLVALSAVLAAPVVVLNSAQAAEIKVVIVPTKGRGGPNLKTSIRKLVQKPLSKNADIVPVSAYQKAAKKKGIPAKRLGSPSTAKSVGPEVGATHVLIIEGSARKERVGKRKKKVYSAKVTLIEVASGKVALVERYAFKGRKMTREVAKTMLDRLEKKLAPPPEPEPEPELEPVAAIVAPTVPSEEAPPVAPAAPALSEPTPNPVDAASAAAAAETVTGAPGPKPGDAGADTAAASPLEESQSATAQTPPIAESPVLAGNPGEEPLKVAEVVEATPTAQQPMPLVGARTEGGGQRRWRASKMAPRVAH